MVDVEVDSDVEVLPGIVLALIFWEWELVSFEESALRDSGVLDFWFVDMASVVVEEVVDLTLAGSEVLVWILNDWFNEESVEYELLCSKVSKLI